MPGAVGLDALEPDVLHLEQDLAAGLEARRDEVLHQLLLAVDVDALAR